MSDEEKNKLENLKAQVLNELTQLSDTTDIDPENRFRLMINLAVISGTTDSFEKAKKAASSIEEPTAKTRALMELLEEIDISLGNITVGDAPVGSAEDKESKENLNQQPSENT